MKKFAVYILILLIPVFTYSLPDFNALKNSWSRFDDFSLDKSSDIKYKVAARKGNATLERDVYMISPEFPECILWIFHGYKPAGDPDKQSPDIIIEKLKLKELSSWYNAVVVIADSGTGLFAYNPDNDFPELQIYCAIYDKIVELKGSHPVVVFGINEGAEGAVKFAPLVNKLYSLICVSGIFDYDTLKPESDQYKMRLREFGSAKEWKNEQPVKIFPALRCRISILFDRDPLYGEQAKILKNMQDIQILNFIENAGNDQKSGKDYWFSDEVKKILYREVQAVEETAD